MVDLQRCSGFEWDSANADKIWAKHKVTRAECEQIFFNPPVLIVNDERHSKAEQRYYALGTTDMGRQLFAGFTVRSDLIRLISARDISRRERKAFDNAKAKNDS